MRYPIPEREVRRPGEHGGDRPEVEALRGVELTGTNTPRPCPRYSPTFSDIERYRLLSQVHEERRKEVSGDPGGGDTPGSMPNPEVKPSSADGTAEGIRGRVGRRLIPFFALPPSFPRISVRRFRILLIPP